MVKQMSFLVLLAIGIGFPQVSLAKPLNVAEMLKKTDDLYRSQASKAKMEMKIETPNWSRTLVMDAWSQGTEKTFVRILKPRKEKGVATLKRGSEVWNFFPKINKVIKVPSSMMMGSWMGSDVTNDDLVKEYRYSEDYTFSTKETANHYIVTLKPKETTVSLWGKIELYLDKSTHLPTEEFYFDEKGKKIRHMIFKDLGAIPR